MIDLDDPSSFGSVDRSDALGAAERVGEQWAEAARRARAADLPDGDSPANVVFCGMGGSGIAGDALAVLAAGRGTVPVAVVKGYDLPAFVGPETLVIAASYSGNTEETLSCVEAALERKARLVALTTGGALAARADDEGVPRIAPVEGLQPRAAFASLLVPTLVVAERLGVLPGIGDDVAEAGEFVAHRARALSRDVGESQNEAKQIARRLEGKVPLIWGQDGPLAVAATRWRCQLNENAKVPAFSSVLPELDHNEIVGYEPGLPALREIGLVVLRGPDEHPRVALRVDATLDAVRDRVGAVTEGWATGGTPLATMMTAAILGDFASIYLALLRGVDPTPVDVLEGLKRRLT